MKIAPFDSLVWGSLRLAPINSHPSIANEGWYWLKHIYVLDVSLRNY